MAELATLSRPYANAVFGIAQDSNSLEAWSRTLGTLVAASGDATVQTMLSSPDLAAQDKANQLAQLCGDEINSDAGAFLQSLAEHDRLSLLAEVREQFEELRAEQEQTLDVEVVSAFDLTAAQSDALQASLQKFYYEFLFWGQPARLWLHPDMSFYPSSVFFTVFERNVRFVVE